MENEEFNKIKEEIEKNINKKAILYKDFIKKELPPTRWVVESLIPEGITILSAAPGHFKTFLLLAIAKQISNGELAFNHFQAEKRNILFVNEEMGEKCIQDRLKTIQGDAGTLYFTNLEGIKLNDADKILNFCKEKNISLVIFDSLTRIHDYQENDASQVKKIFEELLKLLKENISVVLSHHHRKVSFNPQKGASDEMRGSTDILAQIDCHLSIDTIPQDKKYIVIRQAKIRQAENLPEFCVNIEKDDLDNIAFKYKGEFKKKEATKMRIDANKNIVFEIIKECPGSTRDELVKQMKGKIGKDVVKGSISTLIKEGSVIGDKKRPEKLKVSNKKEVLAI